MNDPVARWEADTRRYLDKSSTVERVRFLSGLRNAWRKPENGIYRAEQSRHNPLCGPLGPAYEAALQRLESEFGA